MAAQSDTIYASVTLDVPTPTRMTLLNLPDGSTAEARWEWDSHGKGGRWVVTRAVDPEAVDKILAILFHQPSAPHPNG